MKEIFRHTPAGITGLIRALTGMAAAMLLAGCVHDTASYLFDAEKKQAITLIRSQNWFWKDTVTLAIVVDRLPDCQEGLTVQDVPRSARMELYRPLPGVYAESIYILRIEGRHYAISPDLCRVQAFERTPVDTGALVGTFQEEAGQLHFTPAAAAASGHALR